ncbi:MAG TPA: integrase arm-type DNA-binding domain-containing protein [Methylocella sp.]|jgi:integrase
MPDTRLPLTDRSIAGLPLAVSSQYFVRDTELPGFAVLVGKRKKTFVVQGDIRKGAQRLSIRLKIGGVSEKTTREARAEAKELLGKIAKGIDPRERTQKSATNEPQPQEIPSLRQAWKRYQAAHVERKRLSNTTISNYRDHVERLMADWLDLPLLNLGKDPGIVASFHDRITSDNGPYIANACMRSLRAIYNHARKTARHLPAENPVSAIDWNQERRRDTGLGLDEIPAWMNDLAALDNPIRREFHLFLLLSGSRPDALKRAQISDIDFKARVLRIPKPKGGEAKAFDIPLSRAMILCLLRALRFGRVLHPTQARNWVFPADSAGGHLSEHKENRQILAKWGNDLRQTYRTVAQAAGIADLDVHLLMNHSVAGVNAGYITRGKLLNNHLRWQQETISRKMLSAGGVEGKTTVSRIWPTQPSRRILRNRLD